MDEAETDRRNVALAMVRLRERDYGVDLGAISDAMVNKLTETLDDETCTMVAAAIGTEHERAIVTVARTGFDNEMITEFIRLVPLHDESAITLLHNYFKDLSFGRYYPSLADDFGNIEQLVESARAYREAASTRMLPCATNGEAFLINFAEQYPQFKHALLERINTVDDINQELLDQLTGHPAPSLVDGVL
jgi:hypothetical protein